MVGKYLQQLLKIEIIYCWPNIVGSEAASVTVVYINLSKYPRSDCSSPLVLLNPASCIIK